jgi:hypothetical protein
VAHGVVIDGLTTRVTSTDGSFNPVYSAATPDSSSTRPEPQTVGAFFPATLVNAVERATPQGLRDVVVVHPGQFRSSSPDSGLGFQQLADSMSYRILYSDRADVTPATIGTVDGTVSGGSVTFTVTTPDTDAATATVLYLARSSTTGQTWTSVPLDRSADGHTFTGSHVVGTPTVEQYFVQVVDNANNVSVSSKKGQDFAAPAQPANAGAPVITVLGTPVGDSYVGPQQVVVTGVGPVQYTIDDPPAIDYTGPFLVAGARTHTVTATGPGGTSTRTFTILGTPGPTVTIANPVDHGSYPPDQAITAVFRCDGYQVVSCVPNPATPPTGIGSHTFSVTATDAAGNHTTATVAYAVQYGFVGLLQPVDDGVGQTMSIFKRSSTIPLKFKLLTSTGPLSSTAAAALSASCDLKVSYVAVGTTSAPVDESLYTDAADSDGCFRWDGSQFQYNFGTKSLNAGTIYQLRIRSASGSVADHLLRIGLR